MLVSSRKAKGRRGQQHTRDMLLDLRPDGLFTSTSMGVPGSDIGDPLKLLPMRYTEVKVLEIWPSLDKVVAMMTKKEPSGLWAFTISRNKQSPIWILPEAVMKELIGEHLNG